ncbi:exodeoxyribonuclease V subunit gamma, partial [Salmonella enterica subsp. enterica serovar Kentucky]|nr:exodeoxyribonuclease V subunit gamma [Salmonella enterica subsp. enterica serovar Kentucky]
KAKTVYSTENPDLLVLEFRNDTSAGDGARIEQFDRKGMVNNNWGKLGRDYIYLLSELENSQELDAFADITPDNLLHRIQADILE